MIKAPLITVLMPVYNCSAYINEAVESILDQTFSDFEFLIIDDASTDDTVSKIKAYKDSRINLIQKEKNSGYTNSLNYGLSIAKGKYIARMDGDDISLPERFEKQFDFMEANEDVVVCGTSMQILGTGQTFDLPQNFEDIKIKLLSENCIVHPSVLIRLEVLKKNNILYDLSAEPAEDYRLWVQLSGYGKINNLKDILIKYRVHEKQVSSLHQELQMQSALVSQVKMFSLTGCEFNQAETILLKKIVEDKIQNSVKEITSFLKLVDKIKSKNTFFDAKKLDVYTNALRDNVLLDFFLIRNTHNPYLIKHYLYFTFSYNFKLPKKHFFKFVMKSLLFYNK